MTIHTTHPFLEPEGDRDPVRRLRGRLGGTVSLWTAGASDADRAGLTVSSWLVAGGEPGRVLALLDPDADLTEALLETGRGVVQLLAWPDRGLAEAFAGTAPAPGGPFRMADWVATDHGLRLAHAQTWALVSVESEAAVGWSTLVTCTLDEVVVGEGGDPLVHRRGRFSPPSA
ncbi:flavin reductase (DIM6/NTAB) family NADH-FMN oxidoreductase RutF [Nocardioides sp. BE266]|uniref:flavin reductase family protein n=1 Tax=Nocardioides sp. BE266 TaxID=2817725 RepID=UPI002857C39B|nr:flavin reductase [Nocardioides sp. BE266]MDR7253813.1 flavin reductase (DIM6/NTAB) family NADH-FMN oxidoreductase RutF [Nocardioides sp. BE266]